MGLGKLMGLGPRFRPNQIIKQQKYDKGKRLREVILTNENYTNDY